MKADPNLVPFRDEWLDNLGGMANAVFWLKKNWSSTEYAHAQGERILEDGSRWLWNYSPITDHLLVHTWGGTDHKSYHVTGSKMVMANDIEDANAAIYRPFPVTEDGTWNKDGDLKVVWLNTRRIEVIKSHHFERCPITIGQANSNMHMVFQRSKLGQFPHIELSTLLTEIPRQSGRDIMVSNAIIKNYNALYSHFKLLTETRKSFEDFHMHSYEALVSLIIEFNQSLWGNNHDKSFTEHVKQKLFDMTQALVRKGYGFDATMSDALCFKRPFVDSIKGVEIMVEAHRGSDGNKQSIAMREFRATLETKDAD